ncbi:MAG TPA: ThuA domain-containing protein [Planctomycetota bacterium]|jgi:hypothetical protein
MRTLFSFLLIVTALAFSTHIQAADEAPQKKLKLAVLTGGHGFDRKGFFAMFDAFKDIEYKEFALGKDSTIFDDISKWDFDAMLMYNLNNITDPQKENLLKLLDKGIGLVVMHHAVGNYQTWTEYPKIAGCVYALKKMEIDGQTYASTWKEGVDIPIHVEGATHAITKGIADFKVHDEVYGKCYFAPDNKYLLTTDQPLTDGKLAWTRKYRSSNVFGTILGHGSTIFTDKSFTQILHNGIFWTVAK